MSKHRIVALPRLSRQLFHLSGEPFWRHESLVAAFASLLTVPYYTLFCTLPCWLAFPCLSYLSVPPSYVSVRLVGPLVQYSARTPPLCVVHSTRCIPTKYTRRQRKTPKTRYSISNTSDRVMSREPEKDGPKRQTYPQGDRPKQSKACAEHSIELDCVKVWRSCLAGTWQSGRAILVCASSRMLLSERPSNLATLPGA